MATKIDWCDETINPLGHWCFGAGGTKDNPKPCAYCYAKRLATRGMNGCEKCKTFSEPHTHFEQLEKLSKWKKPRNIFVQSMGDLFHDEVPDDWVRTVLGVCVSNPQHRYLFLTKNLMRYSALGGAGMLPTFQNFWYGVSVTSEEDSFEEDSFWLCDQVNTFVSIEPLLGEFTAVEHPIKRVDWVIIGAESGNRKGKVTPKREWVKNIADACRATGTPVYMKDNLAKVWQDELIKEFPWEVIK